MSKLTQNFPLNVISYSFVFRCQNYLDGCLSLNGIPENVCDCDDFNRALPVETVIKEATKMQEQRGLCRFIRTRSFH